MHLSYNPLEENVFLSIPHHHQKKKKPHMEDLPIHWAGKFPSSADYFESSGSPESEETTEVVGEA